MLAARRVAILEGGGEQARAPLDEPGKLVAAEHKVADLMRKREALPEESVIAIHAARAVEIAYQRQRAGHGAALTSTPASSTIAGDAVLEDPDTTLLRRRMSCTAPRLPDIGRVDHSSGAIGGAQTSGAAVRRSVRVPAPRGASGAPPAHRVQTMTRLTARCLVGVLLLLASACTRPESSVDRADQHLLRGDSLLPLDSVRLAETDSASFYVGQPIAFAVAPSGDVYVSDQVARRVLVFDRDGDPVRQYGTDGRGPGSFGAPGAIAFFAGDSLIVADWVRDVLHVYGGDSLLPVRSVRIRGAPMNIEERSDTLWLGLFNPVQQTGLSSIVVGDSAPRYLGPMPSLYKEAPSVVSSFGFSTISMEKSTILLAYALVPRVYRLASDGQIVDSADVPKRLRRSDVNDLSAAVRNFGNFEQWMNGVSMVTAVRALPDSTVLVVMSDHEWKNNVVGGQSYLVVLDSDLKPLCTDIILRYPANVRPLVAFRGDTLYTLTQEVSDAGTGDGLGAPTYLRRYLVGRWLCGGSGMSDARQ